MDAGAETLRRAEAEAVKQEAKKAVEEHEMTRAEAETTPEALKVKRAKAQAAYKTNQGAILPNQAFDIKVE